MRKGSGGRIAIMSAAPLIARACRRRRKGVSGQAQPGG